VQLRQLAEFMSDTEVHTYIVCMKQDRTFGDGIALSAASNLYGKRVVIFSISPDAVQHIDLPQTEFCEHEQPMYLGLFNEHYVSVRPLLKDEGNDKSSHSQQQRTPRVTECLSGSFGDDTVCKLSPVVADNTDVDNVVAEYDIGNYLRL